VVPGPFPTPKVIPQGYAKIIELMRQEEEARNVPATVPTPDTTPAAETTDDNGAATH
jgi:hypothetical protein